MKKIIIKSLLASTLLSFVLINNTEVANAANENHTSVSSSKSFDQQKNELARKFYTSYNKGEISFDRCGLYLEKLSTCKNEADVSELLNQIENINLKVLVEAKNEAKSILLRLKSENKLSSQVLKKASLSIDKAFDYYDVQAIIKGYQSAYNSLSFMDVKREMLNYNLELANSSKIMTRDFNLNLYNISVATSITELQEYFNKNLANK